MRIIVNHLTRMQPGFICVAGIDTRTGKHIRPELNQRLTRAMLTVNGGIFEMGALVELGPVEDVGAAPEVEDRRFQYVMTRYITTVTPTNFWMMLRSVACDKLMTIFGSHLQQTGTTCTLPSGVGLASLGCLLPSGCPQLIEDGLGRLRLHLTDGDFELSLPVTDLRFYENDQTTPKRSDIAGIARRISSGVPVLLSVGLSRPWQKPGEAEARHWLQINNIHLEDDPLLQGAPS